jgi:plasmid stabilization system protein ParE
MKMKSHSFLPLAQKELQQTVDYYESCSKGLGKRFALEVKSSIRQIMQYPHAWTAVRKELRRYIIDRFPYVILYYVESDKIVIVAVMNTKQRPDYWVNRI